LVFIQNILIYCVAKHVVVLILKQTVHIASTVPDKLNAARSF